MSMGIMEYNASEYAKVRKGEECDQGIKALASKKRPAWVQKNIGAKEE